MGSSWGCPGARAPGAHGLLSGRPDPWLSSRWTWTRTRLSGSTTACWSWTRTSGPPSRAQARRADGDTEGPVRPGGAACPGRASPPVPSRPAEHRRPAVPGAAPPGPLLPLACPGAATLCGQGVAGATTPRAPVPRALPWWGAAAPLWGRGCAPFLAPGHSRAPASPAPAAAPALGVRVPAVGTQQPAVSLVKTGLRVWPLGSLPQFRTVCRRRGGGRCQHWPDL